MGFLKSIMCLCLVCMVFKVSVESAICQGQGTFNVPWPHPCMLCMQDRTRSALIELIVVVARPHTFQL